MTVYNVKMPVVALVEAESKQDAIRVMARHLNADANLWWGEAHEAHAFESEPVENDGFILH